MSVHSRFVMIAIHNSIVYNNNNNEKKKKHLHSGHFSLSFNVCSFIRFETIRTSFKSTCPLDDGRRKGTVEPNENYILTSNTRCYLVFANNNNQIEFSNRCANILNRKKMNYDYEWMNVANDCLSTLNPFIQSFFVSLCFFPFRLLAVSNCRRSWNGINWMKSLLWGARRIFAPQKARHFQIKTNQIDRIYFTRQ